MYIFCLRALASCRRRPLSSNVRPHNKCALDLKQPHAFRRPIRALCLALAQQKAKAPVRGKDCAVSAYYPNHGVLGLRTALASATPHRLGLVP